METDHFPYLVLSKNRNLDISRDLGNTVRREVPLGDLNFEKFI
jgi:hypothetical protein